MMSGSWFSGNNESSVKYIEFLLFDRVDGFGTCLYHEAKDREVEDVSFDIKRH